MTLVELETAAAAAADQRARKARAEAARLRREIERASAERTVERARAVGAAVLAWCATDERVRSAHVRYLRDRLSGSDRDLLRGTPLDLDSSAPIAENTEE